MKQLTFPAVNYLYQNFFSYWINFNTSCLLLNELLYLTYFIQFFSWVSESYKSELPKNTETDTF